MRSLILATMIIASPALAQSSQTTTAAPAAASTHSTATAKYSTDTTDIGTLLDNPATKAVVAKYLPDVVNSDQIDMARSMTLKQIQSYSPDDVTDAKLAQIDTDLAKLQK